MVGAAGKAAGLSIQRLSRQAEVKARVGEGIDEVDDGWMRWIMDGAWNRQTFQGLEGRERPAPKLVAEPADL